MSATRFITSAVYNGTHQNYAIHGKSVDDIMIRIRKHKHLRTASVFMFYSRKTGKLVDVRGN